jgi:broad specificity phosphatase PhoE
MNDPVPPERRRIYLMRHAEVSYFSEAGAPLDPRYVTLTERGRQQASEMAAALADVPFDRAVCSGMPRSRETAVAVMAGRQIRIEDEADFREIKAGRLRNIPPERRRAELVRVLESAALTGASFAGGESFAAFEERVLAALMRLLGTSGWRRLLLVAHDAVNRVLLAWAAQSGLKALAAFEQDMCCLYVIDLDMVDGIVERRIIRLMNYTPYDATKARLFLTSMEQVFGRYVGATLAPTKDP